jgi:quercetin dioxygenase-like cupin family protein
VQIGCMHIGAGGIVGYHQATVRQLFLVVAGTGWVRGKDEPRQPIAAGQAAYWEAGEWHESGSQDGMTAIVIEATTLDPARDMPAI